MEFDPYGVNSHEAGCSNSSNLPPLSFTVNNRPSIPLVDLNQSMDWRIDDAFQPFEFCPMDFHPISTPSRIFQPKTHCYPSFGLPTPTSLDHIALRDCGGGGGGGRGGFFDLEKTKPVYNNCIDPISLGPDSLEPDFPVPRNYSMNRVPFSDPYPLSWYGITPSDPIPTTKTSPGIAFRPPSPVDAFSSAHDTLSFKNLNTGINGIDTNSTGKSSVAAKLPKPPNMSSKGASTSYDDSPFRSSEPGFVPGAKKHEILDGDRGRAQYFLPMKFSDVVKLPPRKPSGSIRMSVENGKVNGSASSSKFPLFPILPTRKRSNLRKTDLNKDYPLFNQSLYEIDMETSLQQGFAGGKFEAGVADFYTKNCDSTKHSNFISKRSFSSYGDNILLERMLVLSSLLLSWCSNHTNELEEKDQKSLEKIINNLHTCMSKTIRQEPSLITGLSGAGVADFHTKANDIHRSDYKFLSRPYWRFSHKILIDRMLSLSDFLMSLCSNYTYELEENDHKSFEETINNLQTCMSKTIRQEPPLVSALPEAIPSQKLEEESNHYSDSKLKMYTTAKNIKKILMEDYNVEEEKDPQVRFYKTLWLDAEAALCSVNCMTRFINTKSEIEKSNFDDEKDWLKDSSDEDETSSFELNEKNDESSKTIEPLATACDDGVDKSFKIKSELTQLISDFLGDSSFELNENDESSKTIEPIATACDDDVDKSFKIESELTQLISDFAGDSSFEFNENDESYKTIEPLAPACDDEVDKSFKIENGLTQLVSDFVGDSSFTLNEKDKLFCDDEVDNSTETACDTDDEGSDHQDFNIDHAGEQSEVGGCDGCVWYGCTIQSPSSTGIGDRLTTNWSDELSSDWEHVSNEEDLF